MISTQARKEYIPAAGRRYFLPLYDPFTRLLGADRARKQLLDQANLHPSYRVLDLGCGTGTLAVQMKQHYPQVQIVGLDPDPDALKRARCKADEASVSIQFDQGFADALPYDDASFDRVFSSFMFHHLQSSVKQGMLREVHRVLKPGGRLELLDFGGPEPGTHGLLSLFRSHKYLKENTRTRVTELLTEAGLADGRCTSQRTMFLFRITYYQANRG